MRINKLLKKLNYDPSINGYFRNKKELIKFLKLTKYFANNRSPQRGQSKNVLLRKYNFDSIRRGINNINNNLVSISKDEYISEFSKPNKIKANNYHSCERITSAKKIQKQNLNEMRNNFRNIYYNNNDNNSIYRYEEIIVKNHNIIMSNVKKFLNINNIEDENKIVVFPYLNKRKNEKKEDFRTPHPPPPRIVQEQKKIKTINNCEKNNSTENSLNSKDNNNNNNINNKNQFIINKRKTCRIFNKSVRKIKSKKQLMKRHSTPILRNKSINIKKNQYMIRTSTNKFISLKNDLLDLTLKTLPLPLLFTPSKKNYTFNYYVNKTYRKQIPLYMKHRLNWNLVTNKEEGYSFRWKYYPGRVNYKLYQYHSSMPVEKMRIINIFENYRQLGNKENFFINFIKYCNKNKINPFRYIPFTIVINKTFMYDKYIKNLEDINNYINTNDVFNLNDEKIPYTKLFSLMKASGISNKDFEDLYIYIHPSFLSSYNYWIIKPPDLFQGMGIKVLKDFKEIDTHCQNLFNGIEKITAEQEEYCKKNNIELKPTIHKSDFIVLQKYLDNPLLYNGRKFDIRCYVLVDYCFNVFMCREGHLKACSQKYDLNDLDIFKHITNYSLQKRCKDFAKYEQGNEISFKKFIELLDNISFGKGQKIFEKIYLKMKEEIQISMNAVGRNLKKLPKVLSFQIFGYDFIIDKEYNPWILEINDNPGLEISSELISHLIPRMVDDALRLTLDKIFPTEYDKEVISQEGNYISKYHLDGFSDEENLFEFICNIDHSKLGKDLQKKNNNNFNKFKEEDNAGPNNKYGRPKDFGKILK